MKLSTILSLAAVATTAVAGYSMNVNTTKVIQGLPLNYTLTPNAVELLQSKGIWAPDPAAFAAGHPNVDSVNITAEVEKFKESGLDANEIVTVTIDNAAAVRGAVAVAVGSDENEYEGWPDCQHCNSCQTGCLILVIFLPLWGA